MREVVYLSDSKLLQFLPEKSQRWPHLGRVNLTTPFGGAEVERGAADSAAERQRQLDKALGEVRRRARAPKDPGVRAGHWVEFETPLHQLVPGGEFAGMLLFLGAAGAEGPRLLLHGSAAHLVNGVPRAVDGPGENARRSFSHSGPEFLEALSRRATPGRALLADLDERPDPTDEELPPLTPLPEAVAELIGALDRQVHPESAARMHGYARATADPLTEPGTGPTHLVASPLLVEYAAEGPV